MTTKDKGWKRLFLFCLGLFAGTAFCMKWMEGDFRENGRLFTIIGLEISYPKERVESILAGLDDPVKRILRYHLYFDFAFMAGVYPGIAALCMMARNKHTLPWLRKGLLLLAGLQGLALVFDIIENGYLLQWIREPVIGNAFGTYHAVVYGKWGIALAGVLLAGPLQFRKSKTG